MMIRLLPIVAAGSLLVALSLRSRSAAPPDPPPKEAPPASSHEATVGSSPARVSAGLPPGSCCAPSAPVLIEVTSLDGNSDPFSDPATVENYIFVQVGARPLHGEGPVAVDCYPTPGLQVVSGSLHFVDEGQGQVVQFWREDPDPQTLTVTGTIQPPDGAPQTELASFGAAAEIEMSGVQEDPLAQLFDDAPAALLVPSTELADGGDDDEGGQE